MKLINAAPFFCFLLLGLLIAVKVTILQKKGVAIASKSRKPGIKSIILFAIFLPVFLIWLFELMRQAFQISFSLLPEFITKPFADSSLIKNFGIALIFVSLILMLLALWHFRDSLRFGLNKTTKGKLITSGIFSVSRNPFFLSLDCYFLGTALVFFNLFFLGYAFLAILGVHFFILKEEKFMQSVYGQVYINYCRKVSRYL